MKTHHIKKIVSGFLPIALIGSLVLLGGCAAEDQYNSKYACSFTFYTTHHPTSSLSAINTTNPGFFVWVEVKRGTGGVNTVYVYQNNGTADDPISLTTEIENNRISYDNMGANGQLILGCTTLNGLRAYDRQCPYCLDTYSGYSYPLTWTDDGASVECSKCGRVYSLNSEGLCTSGHEGSYRLLQYRFYFGTGYDGTTILRVTN